MTQSHSALPFTGMVPPLCFLGHITWKGPFFDSIAAEQLTAMYQKRSWGMHELQMFARRRGFGTFVPEQVRMGHGWLIGMTTEVTRHLYGIILLPEKTIIPRSVVFYMHHLKNDAVGNQSGDSMLLSLLREFEWESRKAEQAAAA